MNYWQVIALILLGLSAGMTLMWFMVRNRIGVKQIHIDKNKQKQGINNTQDIDVEFDEAETLSKRKQKRQNKQTNKELKDQADKVLANIQTITKKQSK